MLLGDQWLVADMATYKLGVIETCFIQPFQMAS